MSGLFVVAGGLMLTGAAIHGLVGDHFLRKVAADALPANALGGPENSRSLVRVSWHFVTVTFALAGIALAYAGFNTATRFAPGIVWFLGVLCTCFAVFSLTAGIYQYGPRFLFRHPAPLGLSMVAILIWWGATGV